MDKLAVSSALSRREESIGDSLIAAKCQAREIGASCAAEAVLQPVLERSLNGPKASSGKFTVHAKVCAASGPVPSNARVSSRGAFLRDDRTQHPSGSRINGFSRACSGEQQKCSVRI